MTAVWPNLGKLREPSYPDVGGGVFVLVGVSGLYATACALAFKAKKRIML